MNAGRRLALLLLLAGRVWLGASEPESRLSDDDLRIEGILASALPGTEPARSWRLIVHPRFGDLVRGDHLRTALGLRHGLTDRWEIIAEIDWFFAHGLQHRPLLESQGLSSLHAGTKYRLGRIGGGPWEGSIGADFSRPVDRPPREITDGRRHFSPYVTFSRELPDRTGWRVFWSASHDFTAATSIPGERPINEFPGDKSTVSGGLVRVKGPLAWTWEAACRREYAGAGDGVVVMLRPGVVWHLPSRLTFGSSGRWLVGAALQLSHGPEGTDAGVSVKMRGNFDFRRVLGLGKSRRAAPAPR
ncbi:MAG: hypothetical protein RIR76_1352 [Verrucomicrobiota bacterium]|jgi:hypothetical protein|nr:hypothetical protein [Opitutaceae bacterium]